MIKIKGINVPDGNNYFVCLHGRHSHKPLFVGSQTECVKYIMSFATPENKRADGTILYRVIADPDGDVYDIGRSFMYQIRKVADGKYVIGLYNNYLL